MISHVLWSFLDSSYLCLKISLSLTTLRFIFNSVPHSIPDFMMKMVKEQIFIKRIFLLSFYKINITIHSKGPTQFYVIINNSIVSLEKRHSPVSTCNHGTIIQTGITCKKIPL